MSGTHLVQGLVMVGTVQGSVQTVENAKIAVFAVGLDIEATDTKGTVLIENADHLKTYNRTEEDTMEAIVKEIADSGANCVVFGSGISEIALHFLERYGLLVCKVVACATTTSHDPHYTVWSLLLLSRGVGASKNPCMFV